MTDIQGLEVVGEGDVGQELIDLFGCPAVDERGSEMQTERGEDELVGFDAGMPGRMSDGVHGGGDAASAAAYK